MKKILGISLVAAMTAAASASITTTLADLGGGLYELRVTTAADNGVNDDWTTASVVITTSGSAVILDPTLGSTDAEFNFAGNATDTFFTRFNGTATFPAPSYAFGPNYTGPLGGPYTSLAADWFDTLTVATQGTDAIARFMFGGLDAGIATITGKVSAKNSGATLFPYSFQVGIPEPTTLSLLALGGLAGLIRRR